MLRAETLAVCLILACSLQIMENLLPKIPIFPWLKLGLAWWILLPFLIRFGVRHTLMLFLFRNLITLLYGGQIFSSFLISSSAGLVSIALAGSILRALYRNNRLGLIGFSVVMAATFNVVQLGVVNQLLIQHSEFYYQLPPILLWSTVSGSLIALLVYRSQQALEGLFSAELVLPERSAVQQPAEISAGNLLPVLLGVAFLGLILYVDQTAVQAGFIIVLLLLSRFRNLKVLIFAWPFYLYIAFLHLFRTEGVYILGEWITQEGLDAFLYYTARTTGIILCGQWIAPFIPALVRNRYGNRYLKGFTYALPILPAIFGISIALGRDLLKRIGKRDLNNLLGPIIQRLLSEFGRMEEN